MSMGPAQRIVSRERAVMAETRGNFRWVLLRHELPDRSWHYDWMIEQEGNQRLVCFRVTMRVDELTPGARFDGERLADHRRAYLEYEGEIGGGRGRVTRVAAGECDGWCERDGGGGVVMRAVKVGPRKMMGRVKSGAVWEFEVG